MNNKLIKIYYILQENTAMKSVISKLYYGEICPCEKPAPQTEQCIGNRKIICDTEEQLLVQFPDCKELLERYTDALHVETQLECEADFGTWLPARSSPDARYS